MTLIEQQQAVAFHQNGFSLLETGKRFGVSPGAVLNALRRAGIAAKPTKGYFVRTPELTVAIVEMYRNGVTFAAITKALGPSSSTIRVALAEHEVPIHRFGRRLFRKPGQEEKIVAAYTSGHALTALAEEHDVSRDAVLTVLRSNNVHIRGPNEACNYPFTDKQGRRFYLRSSWELKFAKWLDSSNICWDYEVERFDVGHGMTYLPDFWIFHPKTNELICLVDVKGWLQPKSKKRIKMFRLAHQELLLIVGTEQLTDLGLLPRVTRTGKKINYRTDMNLRIREMYAAGESTNVIGKKLGIAPTSAADHLRSVGLLRTKNDGKALYHEQHRRQCSIEDCSEKHYGQGLCRKHWSMSYSKPAPKPKLGDEQIIALYRSGLSLTEVGQTLNLGYGSVRRAVLVAGKLRSKSEGQLIRRARTKCLAPNPEISDL